MPVTRHFSRAFTVTFVHVIIWTTTFMNKLLLNKLLLLIFVSYSPNNGFFLYHRATNATSHQVSPASHSINACVIIFNNNNIIFTQADCLVIFSGGLQKLYWLFKKWEKFTINSRLCVITRFHKAIFTVKVSDKWIKIK